MRTYLEQVKSLTEWNWQGGILQWVFYAAILLVLFIEKKKTVKIILGWVPLVYLVSLYSPLFRSAMELAGVGGQQYFARMFSFMPLMYTIALAIVCLLEKEDNRLKGWMKFGLVCAVCAGLVLTGRNIFDQDWYVKASNWEKVSLDTIEVREALEGVETEDGNIRVATIDPVTNYMRQAADFVTPYARNLWEPGPMLSEDPPDVAAVMKMAGEYDMEYILVHRTEATLDAFAKQGYRPYALTTALAIYKVEGVRKKYRTLNEKRQVVASTVFDESGNPVRNQAGYTTVAYEYDQYGNRSAEKYLDESGKLYEVNGGYSSIHREFSPRGLEKSLIYRDADGNPVLVSGRFETRKEYDIYGKLIRESYYDAQGNPMLLTDGLYATREIFYNGEGAVIGERYYSIDRNLCINSSGYAEYRRELDGENRILQESYYDTQGNLRCIIAGYASYTRKYNDAGNVLRETYLDGNGNPVIRNTGYAEIRREYDEKGQMTRETYLDDQGKLVAIANGNYGLIREYDEAGNVVSEIYLDAEGREGLLRTGYSQIKRWYNDKKQLIREKYFSLGKAFTLAEGYHAFTREYNDAGSVIRESYLDAEGNPVCRSSGYAAVQREYDPDNRLIREEYLDEDGKLVLLSSGNAGFTREYDEAGRVTREAYFDTEGKPTAISAGYASLTREYDSEGRLAKEAYFDTEENSFAVAAGYAAFTRSYSTFGLLTEEAYFDTEGKPVLRDSGYAVMTRAYNRYGDLIQERYLDEQGEAIACTTGFDEYRREYDELRRLTAERYYLQGQLFVRPDLCYAGFTRSYDERGNVIKEAYEDDQGNPALRKEGYAAIVREYNDLRQNVFEKYLDEAGNPAVLSVRQSSLAREYDVFGNVIRETYGDGDGNPILRPDGFATVTREYNALKQLVREEYLDCDGHLVMNASSFAGKEREFDDRNNLIRESYYGPDGKPVISSTGYAEIKRVYDRRSNCIEELYLAPSSKDADSLVPIANADGHYGIARSYSFDGKLQNEAFIESEENRWILIQYGDRSGNQAMCYALVDPANDDLILIDGGWTENAEQVRKIIESNGGKVKAWFLTHYHGDHASAFNTLWEEYRDRIERVYVTPLDWDDFSAAAQYWDTPETFETFLRITEGDDKIVQLHRSDELDIGIFHVKNFNTYDDQIKSAGDIPNNCSLMLKFTAGEYSMLFCGDIHGEYLSNYIMEQFGDELKADLVQPGHHGNNTMSYAFYGAVNPKIMTFDAPEWLMTGETYTAKDMKAWCEERGIRVYDYTTAPNVFTVADLEQ